MEDVRLILGDALEVLRNLADGFADAVVTDPPYGIGKAGWDEAVAAEAFRECLRVCRGYAVFFSSNTRLWHTLGAVRACGWEAWVLAWSKNNAMGCERRFTPLWVPIVCAYRRGAAFWGRDVVECPITPQDVKHPTPKPPAVMRWLVRHAAPEGGLVLDPFMGSGTTGLTAVQLGRKFLGVEIDPDYFAEACRRIEDARSEGPLFARQQTFA